MSGYVVTNDNGSHRNFYMVNNADPDSACAEINHIFNVKNAQALVALGDDTIAHFEVVAGSPWIYTTVQTESGKVTSSQIGDDGRRRPLR